MYEFTYRKSESIDEAASMFKASEDARYLAGGMTLLPTMKQRLAAPDILIDLNGISSLRGIEKHNNVIVIGALTTHAQVAASLLVQRNIPALAHLASVIGDPQVRNRGTLGGSVANSDPAADYPAALVGLNSTIQTNKRLIEADEFFIDLFETALEDDEIITTVSFPIPDRAAYCKFPNPASGYATVGVFVACQKPGTPQQDVRVAVTGAAGCVYRQESMEKALCSSVSVASLADIEIDASEFNQDIHASAEYRAHLVGVMARRAVQLIVEDQIG